MQVRPPPQQMQSAHELYGNAAMHVQESIPLLPSRSIQSGQHNTLPFRALGPSTAPFTLTTRKPFPDIPGTYSYKTNMHNILRDVHGMAARKQAGPVFLTLTE